MNFQTLRLFLLFLGQISLPSAIDFFLSFFGYKATNEKEKSAEKTQKQKNTGKNIILFSFFSVGILTVSAAGILAASHTYVAHRATEKIRNNAEKIYLENPETGKLEELTVIDRQEVEHLQLK